jgi:hypothetical protein
MQEQAQTGNYRYVSIMDAVIEAKDDLGITNSIHDVKLINYAYKAVLDMNPLSLLNIINEEVDVEGGIALMPNNCITFLAMRYCDGNGRTYGAYMADLPFLERCGCVLANADVGNFRNIVGFSDDRFIWYDPAHAPVKIKVAFVGRKTDPSGSGMVLIRDYMVDAVAYYIKWRFSTTMLNTNPPRYTPFQNQKWESMWIGTRAAIISGDAQKDYFNRSQSFYNKLHPPIISF